MLISVYSLLPPFSCLAISIRFCDSLGSRESKGSCLWSLVKHKGPKLCIIYKKFLLLLPHAGTCTVYAGTRAGLHLSFISKIEVLPLAPFKIYFLSPTTCKHDILILRVLCQWYSSGQDLLTHITDY